MDMKVQTGEWPVLSAGPKRLSQLAQPDWLVAGSALFIIGNGLSICVGWWTQTPILVQLFASDAPTHFNTAVSFILLGSAEMGLILGRRSLVLAAAGMAILLAVAEFAQQVFGMNLRIDTLFAAPFVGADSLHPGRMSTNTMACFILVGGAQLLMLKGIRGLGAATTGAIILKTLAAGIAFVALLGYVVDLKSAYGWSESVGMSVRSWAGFLLIAVARIAALWKRDIADQPRLPDWFLPFLAVAISSIAVGLIWVFTSPEARPFSIDPRYAASAHRISVVVELTMAMTIALATISVLAARRKGTLAWRHAGELGVQILKRTHAEFELRSNNEALLEQDKILNLAQVMVRDVQGRITRWSDGAQKLYGYTHEEALGRISHELLATRFPRPLRELEAELETTGVWEGELSHRSRGGAEINVASVWIMHRDENGRPSRILESNSDVTERRRAEIKLSAQLGRLDLLNTITRAIAERQDLASIFEVVIGVLEDQLPIDFGCLCLHRPPDGLTVVGCGLKSRQLAAQLGLIDQAHIAVQENGLLRCVRGQLVYEPDVAEVKFAFPQRLAASGLRAMVAAPLLVESAVFGVLIVARRAPHSFSSGECEFLGQLAQHVALAAHQAQLYATLEAAYEDLRKTQQAVMRQEKLRVLGQMASGIAHDINNALSPAALYVESLLERESAASESKEYLTIIQRAIEGVAQTVARMKEFYSQRDPQLAHVAVSLNRAASQVIDLTRARWNSMPQESGQVIDVVMELELDLPDIAGNESEIRDAITNLILNAVDAMPDGGRLTVSTGTLSANRVQLRVTDTGHGMDEATRSRCLELFFSTKGMRGTGLGLAMVYGTVERHGGELQIESEPGIGTEIRLIFSAAAKFDNGAIVNPDSRPRRRLRILLIDDDPIILKSLLDTLERDAHTIEVADGGQRGIDAFGLAAKRSEPFDVVITDLGMPHIDGRIVASAVKAMAPLTPVVLLTGWGHRMLAENDTPPNVDRVLGKPPKLMLLRATLAELTQPEAT